MIIDFLEVFPSKDSCINLISEKHIFVYEDSTSKKGIFVKANEVHHIHIQNDIDDDCFFVQNDDCVMISEKGGQCDYVIFNSEKLYFVEVKATDANLKTHKQKMYKQLENTFKFYKNFLEKFENKFALACFENINPRGFTKRKIPQSSKSEKKLLFKMKYDIELLEGNYIGFD